MAKTSKSPVINMKIEVPKLDLTRDLPDDLQRQPMPDEIAACEYTYGTSEHDVWARWASAMERYKNAIYNYDIAAQDVELTGKRAREAWITLEKLRIAERLNAHAALKAKK